MNTKVLDKPIMHCQKELERDLSTYSDFMPNELLMNWFNDSYSTSKHLLTLFSIVRGANAQHILEVGFGRSSFVLAKAAGENGGQLTTCDTRDFSYLLNEKEQTVVNFVHGKSDNIWQAEGVYDFAFLDYFSGETIPKKFVLKEIKNCIKRMKTNGIIAIHDSVVEKYSIRKALNSLRSDWTGRPNGDLELMSLPYNYGLALIRVLKDTDNGELVDTFKKKAE